MRSLVGWSVRNSPAVNTLMVAVVAAGLAAAFSLRRESFPEFHLEYIIISVAYPGASPEEVEAGICEQIEEAVRNIDGVEKVYSAAREGIALVTAQIAADVTDVQRVLGEIRSEIDRIASFPENAEDPQIKQLTLRNPAIRVAVIGGDASDPTSEHRLRELAEQVRHELLQLVHVHHVELIAAKPYQIDIEIREEILRKYGLTLQQVAQTVRRENTQLPAGSIKTDAAEYLVRGENKHTDGPSIARLPLVTQPDGVVLTVGDIGTVHDGFADTTAISRIDGRPALAMVVQKTRGDDLLKIAETVQEYVRKRPMPAGYELRAWGDESRLVRERLDLLTRNGVVGLILVFVILSLLLEIRLSFWVAWGMPFSILGALAVMCWTGETMNMISMFGLVMVLGMVVDDAIVVGESIYSHREKGRPAVQAAVDGTVAVAAPVVASVLTTIVAFLPLFFVDGVLGKFIAVMPLAVVATLTISLLESLTILPCHLALIRVNRPNWSHDWEAWAESGGLNWIERRFAGPIRTLLRATAAALVILGMLLLSPIESVARFFDYVRDRAACGLTILTEQYYVPTLRWILVNPVTAVAGCIAMLLVCGGLIAGGLTPFVYFPKLDDEVIRAVVVYPHGTPAAVTEAAARRLEDAALAVAREYSANGTPVVNTVFRLGGQIEGFTEFEAREGSHLGQVQLELAPSGEREVRSREFIARWRDLAGEFPGAVELTFAGVVFGPGGKPIEFKILGTDLRLMDAAVERIKSRLASYPGVFDVRDDHQPGKWERRLSIRPEATAMGIRLADLAETVRASYHGEEVMRLQRGRHEVKLMVRYPPQERKSLANFDEIHVRTPSGDAVPLPVLAQVDVVRGVSQITRFNQLRSITVTADLDEQTANARQIVDDLQTNFVPAFLREFPGVSILWEGQQQDTTKAFASLSRGFAAAIFVNYVLLTLQFRSCLQPLLVLITVPFGMIGAVLGHLLLGLPLTMFTMFGLVALAGVVVNDAILLIDFINRRWVAETDLTAALIESGRQRVRPILLTSVTTIGGLCPIMLEKSVQAQVLTPMAVSLSFGLMFSTVWVLLLLPALYRIYAAVPGVARAFQREAAEMASPSSPAVPQP